MAYFTLDIPPGAYRTGTDYKSRGRFYDVQLWRWYAGEQRPVGGWVQRSRGDQEIDGKARAIITWRDNTNRAWAGIGSNSNLYSMVNGGYLYDITPYGFQAGNADAIDAGGYGLGLYGEGDYGFGEPIEAVFAPVAVWTLDTWGQNLVGCMASDGYIYEWSPQASDTGKEDTGTAQAGAASTITLEATASATDDFFNGYYIVITGGTGTAGEQRLITDYVGSTKVATVNNPWSVNPDATTTYEIRMSGRIANAPKARAVVVTAERIMMALGADGDPRLIKNSDLEDNTEWTETTTNYARSYPLQTAGQCMAGRRVNGGTLILTDVDAWLATFVGQPYVYTYQKAGSDCGLISQGGVTVMGSVAIWMGKNGFWMFDQYVTAVVSEVHDYVFSDLNFDQASKVTATHNSLFQEVRWDYPSADSTENDRYVTYNYKEGHWSFGQMERLCGADQGAFTYPLMIDGSGIVWDHERGFDHGGLQPYAESGPVEIEDGTYTVFVDKIVPDTSNIGAVDVTFNTKIYPNGPSSAYGPYSLTDDTDVSLSARQVSVKMIADDDQDFRIGSFRFEFTQMGKR